MNYLSTRGRAPEESLSSALLAGLAPDGGLYMPVRLPVMEPGDFADCHDMTAVGERLLQAFFEGDALEPHLPEICEQAFAVSAPLVPMRGPGDYCLELFHGPTAAFKDFAARFLAACLAVLHDGGDTDPLNILVATSGDTGSAVASAFDGRSGFRVIILYPDGGVSSRQAHCLECWGENVHAFRVAGSFDDCQKMVKTILAEGVGRPVRFTSANSISLGRLLPQLVYYAEAALTHWRACGRRLNFIVPAGNLGNALGCVMARRTGLPIGDIHLACNANATLPDYFAGQAYHPRPGQRTLANAMDVGAPSNFERLRHLYGSDERLRQSVSANSVDDEGIASVIRNAPDRYGWIPCPHTACALQALEMFRDKGDDRDWAVVATAHAAKFDEIIQNITGRRPTPPPGLADCLERPRRWEHIAADSGQLKQRLRDLHT